MIDVLVETNWVVGWAAPPHRALPAAASLLDAAREQRVRLHIPAICIAEARRTVRKKFQPRHEADAIRAFLSRAGSDVSASVREATLGLLSRYESATREWFVGLDEQLASLRCIDGVHVFSLDETMLERSIALSYELDLAPFDQAVLAAVLERAGALVSSGSADVVFCELDSDLHFRRKSGEDARLRELYDRASVRVLRGFDLSLAD